MDATSIVFLFTLIAIGLATDLGNFYGADTTLTTDNSPYYVTENIIIAEGYTFSIENGVELIFNDEFEIDVKGTLNVGCNNYDTSNINTRGLANTNQYTHIHDLSGINKGTIRFDRETDAYGIFCNVLFEHLSTAISGVRAPNSLSFDNCEFRNMSLAANFYDNQAKHNFNDCYFHDLDYVVYFGFVNYYNCLFENLADGTAEQSDYTHYTKFYNSLIIGDNDPTHPCVTLRGLDCVIENTTITDCSVAVSVNSASLYMRYSEISNSDVALEIYHSSQWSTITIEYNNIINNVVNIELTGLVDLPNANYNYFGIASASQSTIGSKIYDICDGYSNVLVTWWPWYASPIDFNDLSNLPTEYSFTSLECTGIDNHPSVTGNRLNVIYLAGTTTTLSNTTHPYYVVNDVVIQETAVFNINNGVEIIFVDDYDIIIKGAMNAGCYDVPERADWGINTGIGYTYIHPDTSLFKTGSLVFDGKSESTGVFCNVLFEELGTAITFLTADTARNDLYFDNCEFKDITLVSSFQFSQKNHQFIDCYFHDLDSVNYGGYVTFDHCYFQWLTTGLYSGGYNYITVYNSEIIGNTGQSTCVSGVMKMENSTVSNCNGLAVDMYCSNCYYEFVFKYNEISDSNIGIHITVNSGYTVSGIVVEYNNFVNVGLAIQLTGGDVENGAYNYYGSGSTDAAVIRANISDICDGYSDALFRFWPWFVGQIDIGDRSAPSPQTATISTFECSGVDNHPEINGSRLNLIYLADTVTILTVTNSPYYVTNDVVIQERAVVQIENGVEIAFMDDYAIKVRGTLNGCYDIDTGMNHNRGLSLSNNMFTHIHSKYNNTKGGIYMDADTNSTGKFCNVLFESLNTVINTENFDSLWNTMVFDNCEFKNCYKAASFDHGRRHNFTYCWFHGMKYINTNGGGTSYDNCLFEDFYSINPGGGFFFYMSNSDVIGNRSNDIECLTLDAGIIQNTSISNCSIGLELGAGAGVPAYVSYCNIYGNDVGIHMSIDLAGKKTIQYNNFYDNIMSIELAGTINCDQCSFNYYGTSSTNQADIGITISDLCDSYSTALFIFWPWSNQMYTNLDSIEQFWTFDFVDCDSLNNAQSYYITNSPTNTPTNTPTTAPTMEPTTTTTETTTTTNEPTRSPETDGSANSTVLPRFIINIIFVLILVTSFYI